MNGAKTGSGKTRSSGCVLLSRKRNSQQGRIMFVIHSRAHYLFKCTTVLGILHITLSFSHTRNSNLFKSVWQWAEVEQLHKYLQEWPRKCLNTSFSRQLTLFKLTDERMRIDTFAWSISTVFIQQTNVVCTSLDEILYRAVVIFKGEICHPSPKRMNSPVIHQAKTNKVFLGFCDSSQVCPGQLCSVFSTDGHRCSRWQVSGMWFVEATWLETCPGTPRAFACKNSNKFWEEWTFIFFFL